MGGRLNAEEARRAQPPGPARTSHDVIVVGGGPAGLSAALVLGRARRRTLIVDSGRPANRVSEAVGGLLGHDARPGAELRRSALAQVLGHPTVEMLSGEVRAARPTGSGFEVELAGGASAEASVLLIAHGMSYRPPRLTGLEALWGKSVFHCPFCDGWEVRERPLAVYGAAPPSIDQALLVGCWSDQVVLCTDGGELEPGQRRRLAAAGVRIRTERILRLQGSAGRLERIRFRDGASERAAAMFVVPEVAQPGPLAAELGCELTAAGLIDCDANGRTGVPGIFAAGDAIASVRSVAIAIGSGARAAKAIVLSLATEPKPRAEAPALAAEGR